MRQIIARIYLVPHSIQFILSHLIPLHAAYLSQLSHDVGDHLDEPLPDSKYQSQAQTQVVWYCIALCYVKKLL